MRAAAPFSVKDHRLSSLLPVLWKERLEAVLEAMIYGITPRPMASTSWLLRSHVLSLSF